MNSFEHLFLNHKTNIKLKLWEIFFTFENNDPCFVVIQSWKFQLILKLLKINWNLQLYIYSHFEIDLLYI